MKLTTEAELAEDFGITPERAAELRNKRKWPHVRFGRFDVRYTDAQVEQIVKMQSETPKAVAPAPVAGQTQRSASRRSA
jgi:hypothetical protein